MTGHRRFCVPNARAAFLEYLTAKRPEMPHLRLYFATPDAFVGAASKYDIESDW